MEFEQKPLHTEGDTRNMKKKLYAVIVALFLAFTMIPAITLTATETYAAASTSVATVKLGSVKANSSNKATLTWKKVSGASGYRVYRKTSGTSWKALKTVNAKTLSYADTSVKAGTKYTYTVRAYKKVNGKNVWGGYNKKGLSVTTPTSTSVATVKLGSIKANASNKVTLTWKKVSGVNGYRVYRKTSGTSWKALKTVSSKTLSYVDTSVKAGTKYTYTVRAYKKISGKTYWGGYNKKGLTATTPKAVDTSVAAVKLGSIKANSSTKVTLTWKKVSGANGYRVYRKTSSSSWQKLKDVGASTLSYADTSAKTNTKYTYTVRAYKKISGKTYWGGYDKTGLTATTPACTHSYKTTASTPATCTSEGKETQTCSVCGNIRTVTIEALGHKWDAGKITIEPTCTEKGIKTYTCTTCKETKTESTAPALGHQFIETVIKEPTCVEAGIKEITCAREDYYVAQDIPATGKHTRTEGVVTRPATCTEEGQKTITCSECGEVLETESIERLPHKEIVETTKTPSCTEEGRKVTKCSECGEILSTESIEKVSHTYELTDTVDPSCGVEGKNVYKCVNCESSYEEGIAALEHNYVFVEASPSSCKEAGYKLYRCERCKDEKKEALPLADHNYTSVVEKGTCLKKETTIYTCTSCKDSYSVETGDYGDHLYEQTSCQNATCDTDGYSIKTCKYCKDEQKETLEKTGHAYQLVDEKASTCTENGYRKYECQNCHDVKQEVFELSNHTPGEWVTEKEATEAEKGLRKKYCEVCGKVLAEEVLPQIDTEYIVDLGNGETTTVWGHYDYEMAQQVYEMLNEYRVENGLSELATSTALTNAVNIRGYEIAYSFSHTRPNGYKWSSLTSYANGENIAAGYPSAEAVMTGWKNSSGHNENMLRSSFHKVAISVFCKREEMPNGAYYYKYYAVQLFGC